MTERRHCLIQRQKVNSDNETNDENPGSLEIYIQSHSKKFDEVQQDFDDSIFEINFFSRFYYPTQLSGF